MHWITKWKDDFTANDSHINDIWLNNFRLAMLIKGTVSSGNLRKKAEEM